MRKQLKIGIPSISQQLSPFNIFSSDYEICRALFSPLFKLSTSGELLSNVVKEWKEDVVNNEYILIFREDVYFHNGRNVVAKDFEFTLCRGMMKGSRETFSQLLSDLIGYEKVREGTYYYPGMCSGIQVLGLYEIKLKLSASNQLFLTYFTRSALSLVPKEELEESNLWVWKNKPIGIGAYIYESISEDGKLLTLKRNSNYFDYFPNSFSELLFIAYQNISEVDLLAEVETVSQGDFALLPSPINVTIAIEYFMLNDNDEIWKDLRQLISTAIYESDILSSLSIEEKELYIPSKNFVPDKIIPKVTNGYKDTQLDFDDVKQDFLKKWGGIPGLSVIIYENYTEQSNLRKMQYELYNILLEKGFNVIKTNMSSLSQEISENQQHILVSSSSFNYNSPEDLSLFFSSDKEIYRAKTRELTYIRKLLKEGKKEKNLVKRNKLYQEIEHLIMQNKIVAPLALTYEYYLYRPSKFDGESFFGDFHQPAYEYIIPR